MDLFKNLFGLWWKSTLLTTGWLLLFPPFSLSIIFQLHVVFLNFKIVFLFFGGGGVGGLVGF